MSTITLSRPFEYDHLETLHIRIPQSVMHHLVDETEWWGVEVPRLHIRVETLDSGDYPSYLVHLEDTDRPESGHWALPEPLYYGQGKKKGKIKAWDYFFRSHKFPEIAQIPKFSGIIQCSISQGSELGSVNIVVQPFVEEVKAPKAAVEGKIRTFSGFRGIAFEDGFARTIVWHRFESPDGEPIDLRMSHKSDASWKVEVGGETIERADPSFIGAFMRGIGYRRTTYQVEKCNFDLKDHPDLYPFGVE